MTVRLSGVWLRHLIGGPTSGLGIESKHLPAVQHACPHLTVFVRHGLVEISIGMRGNRRPVFFNPGCLGIQFDQRAVCSAPPRISEGIEPAAFRGHHMSAAVQIENFSSLNVQHLDRIAPIRRTAASPIPAVVRNGVVVAAVGLERPLLHDLAGRDVEFAVAGVVTDEHATSAHELQVARLRMPRGHNPVLRLIVFVDTQELGKPLVDDQEIVLDDSAVRALADGRAYSGRQALKLGLIDAIGDERDARAWLQAEKGIDLDLTVRELKPATTFAERVMKDELSPMVDALWKTLFSQRVMLDGPWALWQH